MGEVVKGFVEKDDTERLEQVRFGMLLEIMEVIDRTRDQILASDNAFKAFMEACVERFVESATLEGVENVPEQGKVIIASNHPFGMPDMSSLMSHLTDKQPERPWKCIGNGTLMGRITPSWESMPSFTRNFIPVKRKGGKTFAKVENGREIIDGAAEFLEQERDPMLFIAPEGADATYQNRIGRPYKGFAEIARRSNAPIVPVLFTGKADLNKKRFKIRGQVLEPFEATHDPITTCNEWVTRLYRRLFANVS